MHSQWAYRWIIWLSQMKTISFVGFAGVSGLLLIGNIWTILPDITLAVISLLLMALLAMKLLDSVKTGLLMGLFSLFVILLSLGALGWLTLLMGERFTDSTALLGWVVVMTMMMSHLIHFMVALLRAMARGSFQQDAIAESIAQTHQPILLSSLTTIVGFTVASYFNSQYEGMAMIVVVGVVLSYLMVLTWLPWLLNSWSLEFRVGQYEDRHGLKFISGMMENHTRLRVGVLAVSLGLMLWTMFQVFQHFNAMQAVLSMVLASFVLLLLVWRDLKISLLATAIGSLSVIVVLSPMYSLGIISNLSALVLVVPMGIVLDDVVHFFSRYLKAEQSFFTLREDKTRFALASVGRSIWLTSQLLWVGLGVLLFSGNEMIRHASLTTMLSILLVSFLLLTVVPAYSTARFIKSRQTR